MQGRGKLLVLTAIFLTMLTAATFVSAKQAVILGLLFVAGGIPYALTFPCVDIVTEVYGRRSGVRFVLVGLVAHVMTLGVLWMALALPAAGHWEGEGAFLATLEPAPRLVWAGVLAFLVAQLLNVWVFEILREATNGRLLWMRSIVSTGVAQLVDTAIFVPLAFMAMLPARDILFLGLGQFTIKVLIAILAAILVYAGRAWLGEPRRPTRREERGEIAFAEPDEASTGGPAPQAAPAT